MIDLLQQLETDRTILRKITAEDTDFVYKHFSDEELCKYMVDNEPVKTEEEATEIITWSHGDGDQPTNNRWLIIEKVSNEPVGTIGFHRWDRENQHAEIGYDLQISSWGKGLMSEVMDQVFDFGFNTMKLHRIQAIVHIENHASYYRLKNKGFTVDGIIRDMYYYRGKFHDHYMLSLLSHELISK